MTEIVESFEGKNILVVGDIMLDKYVWGSASRISPEAPVPIVVVESTSVGLGGAANVANNIKALGGNALLVGVVGKNSEGDELKSLLSPRGVNQEGIITDAGRPTTSKTRIIAHKQQVVRMDWEKTEKIEGRVADKLLHYVEKVIKLADAVVISDYDKGVITPYLCEKLIKIATEKGKKILVDPKPVNLNLFKKTTLITPNHQEAISAMGLSGSLELSIIGEKMIDRLKLDAVLITLGEKGMFLKEKNGEELLLPAHTTDVFDVTGAGDTVVSTLSLCLAANSSFKEAAVLANYSAGISVTKLGAVAVTRNELLAMFL